MPNIFLSHSNQDHETALRIVESLRAAGFSVWIDFENARGSAEWLCEMEAGIKRSGALLTLLGKESAQSTWQERECRHAFQLKKPVMTALLADVLIPLQLINIDYCDLREQSAAGLAQLASALQSLLQGSEEIDYAPESVSNRPSAANFFPYIKQLPGGADAMLVAEDLFDWARENVDEVIFAGKVYPGFHARLRLRGQMVTLFSLWAYPKTPSIQVPLDYLAAQPPYQQLAQRQALLGKLNQLLPQAERIKAARAKRRPSFALQYLNQAERLGGFKAIVEELMDKLQEANPPA